MTRVTLNKLWSIAIIKFPLSKKPTNAINVIVINRLVDVTTVISDIKDDKVELLEQESLVRIYAENGKVFARTENGLYQIKLRLYKLEKRLDNSIFVRISNSEIVNLKKVKSLDLSFVVIWII